MKKRLILLILILAVLVVVCAAAEENGKRTEDNRSVSINKTWKLFSVDSLQAGCYPVDNMLNNNKLSDKLSVIDQQDDPDWVMPKSSVIWFAVPGEVISIWDLIPQVSDMKPHEARFFAEQEVSYGREYGQELNYSEPGTYNLKMKLQWGNFYTITDLTLIVYPQEEWYGKDETVTVKNYAELQKAINETRANHILISSKFKYGKADSDSIKIYGERKVTISPENDEHAVIDGKLTVSGNGALVLHRVDIESKTIGLDVGGGIHVTACKIHGGSAADSGFPAVTAANSEMTIEEAVGGDGKTGIGGDGIYAIGGAIIEVKSAHGGSAETGVGGSGIVVMGGAKVTVTDEATGGNGQIAPGKATLSGLNGEIILQGKTTDGVLLESKKPVNPDEITSFALLQNALRNGKTEINLSPKFKITEKNWEECYGWLPLFASGDQTVTITGPANGKALKVNGTFRLNCGKWLFTGIQLNNSKKTAALGIDGYAEVEWNGDISVTGSATNAVVARGLGQLTVNGNIASSSKDNPAVALSGSPTIRINGSIIQKGNNNALILRGGKIAMNGNISSTASYPVIWILYGQMKQIGNITSNKSTCVHIHEDGIVQIQGEVQLPNKKFFALYIAMHGFISVDGTIDAPYPGRCRTSPYGEILLNGTKIDF